ncbi:hypothetical protein ABWH92_12340 [Ahrensia marina]|uniref:hypothetical protein n=1 Tax=Ahrensia marina TaxID=1514904 RepID=UPI0035D0F14C
MTELTDEEVRQRIIAAHDALGADKGASTHGNTALEAARGALSRLLMSYELLIERREREQQPGQQ